MASLPLAAHSTCSQRAPPGCCCIGDQPLGGQRFDFGHGVIGVERHGLAEFIGCL